ncbi:unnamed protein product [Prunus armeniaca]
MIKVLRTDRGGEYNSKAFENFCAIHGVRRQLTTPKQNGVAERKNRIILNMVRSMKTKSFIPKSFWPEAVNRSIHILNKSPTFVVRDLTPEEAWSSRKPAVGYFKVFGCIAYARIPDEKMNKLDDKCERCVFLGISEVSKAYKLFNPVSKKIIISRDVVFDEEKTWNWNSDPVPFSDAIKEPKWQKAMIPQGQKTIGVKWVFKTKLNEKGEIHKHKARLVAKGYKQEYGIDYTKVFPPVARPDTIRLVISLAAQNSWPIFQLDVKSAFLHGELQEQVYVEQPSGYV